MIWLGLPILAVLVGARCAWRIGTLITGALRFHSPWERAAFTLGAGLAVMSCCLFFIGIAGGIYRPALWAIVALVALGDLHRWRRPSARTLAKLLPLMLLLLPFVARALLPPRPGDGLLYHLPLAKSYSLGHAIRPLWWLRFPVLPLFAELQSTLQYALAGELAVQLNQTLMLALLACAVYAWGARAFNPTVGTLAAAGLVGNPIAGFLGTSAYTDVTLALFFTLSLAAAANWRATGERGWLWAAGAFAGCAASCKYTGLLACLFVAATVRRPGDLLRLFAAALAVAAPFYAYIVLFTHNPLFPFFSDWFGYRYWNAADLREQILQMKRTGAGRGLKAFLLLPWNLVFHQDRFAFEGDPSPFCFLALPALVPAAWFDRRIRPLLLAVAAYLPLWFFRAQFPRYLMPIAPTLHLAAAASVSWLAERAPRVARRLGTPPLLAAASVCLLAPTLWGLLPPATVPRNAAERFDYLSNAVPGFRAVANLNTRTKGRYSLYAFDAELAFFAEGRYMGDWFGSARFVDFQPSFTDCAPNASSPMLKRLRELGVDHVLFRRKMLPQTDCPWFHFHFEEEFDDRAFALYRVVY